MAYLDESGLARYDGLLKNWVEEDAEITAAGSIMGRTLPDRFADVINVKDFGAVGDGVTDDTAAIQSAFDYAASKEEPCCIYFPQGVFALRCAEPTTVRTFAAGIAASFTSPVEIAGCGAVLKADPGSTSINILCSITTIADIFLHDITVDCNDMVETGIDIYRTPNSSGTRKPYADCRIDNITIKNVYKWSTALTDSALYITGEFRTVIIDGAIINKCVAADTLTLGLVGVYGITINRLNGYGGETNASNNVFLNNITVEDVYCEDPSYAVDQDAIRIFSNYKPDDAKINLDSALVSNVYCRNIRGRIAKCQMHYVTFNNANLVNDGDGAGFVGILPSKGVIENQCGGVNINNMNVYVKNSHICSSLVRGSHIVTLKQDSTVKYPGISYQGGVNISNVKAVIILDTTLEDSFNTDFNAFLFALHRETGSTSVDSDLAGSYIFNFNNIIIESSYSFNTFVNFSRGEAVRPVYYNLSNCVCSCRSVLIRTSGTSTEKNISTSMVNVKNLAPSPAVAFTQDYSKKSSFSNVNGLSIGSVASRNEQNMVPVIYCNGDSQYTPMSTDIVVAESVTGICSVGIIGAEVENNGNTTYYNARLHLGTKSKKEIGIVRSYYGSSSHLILGANGTEIASVDENCFRPQAASLYSLGLPQYTWSNVYADTGPWASSDARLKSEIDSIPDAVMRAWSRVHVKVFKYKSSIENKGVENARVHLGFIAQEVLTAFSEEGLDAFKYGILGYDKWDDEYEPVEIIDSEAVLDADGNVLEEAKTHIEQRLLVAAGDRYSIRYEEALALECAYQRWRLEQIEARLDNGSAE